MKKIGIVIVAFNNVNGLDRLLKSINTADYPCDVSLVISVDFGGSLKVIELANRFVWEHGDKIVIPHDKNLGLKTHILKCGTYMDKYGWDAQIVLEDDVIVSEFFYIYALATVEKYGDDEHIGGISLYKHEFNIFAKQPFIPYDADADVFFLQYAQSWGQVWLKKQWHDFVDWYESQKYEQMDRNIIPANILSWNASWLKFHIMYLIDNDLFFVYPRISFSTNCADAGEHNQRRNSKMQVQLCERKRQHLRLPAFDSYDAVHYDAFFENMSLPKSIGYTKNEACIDLYGVKMPRKNDKVWLTTQRMPYHIIKSFGLVFRPIEKNIIENVDGKDIFLYDLKQTDKKPDYNGNVIFEYGLKGINLFTKMGVRFLLSDFVNRVGIYIGLFKKKIKKRLKKKER